jgi:hypothetical protein
MPSWLRKFLNLDDEMPGYGSGTASVEPEYNALAAPSRPAASYTSSPTYTPPAPPTTYTPSSPAPSFQPLTQGTPASETMPRFASSYSPPPPPAAAPRNGEPATSQKSYLPNPSGEGYIQPIGYGLRSYARGVLPPQGLEQFTREFRATLTDVWNLYSYWTRFQTDELVRIGKEVANTVIDNLPSSPGEPASANSGARRIKVTVGNGNGNGHDEKKVDRVATTSTIDPPPVPTPAAPPTPPAPTAKFSATVTADDAVVPPAGKPIPAPIAAVPITPPTPPVTPPTPPVKPPTPLVTPPPPVTPSAPAADAGGPRIVKPKGRATDKSNPEDGTKSE